MGGSLGGHSRARVIRRRLEGVDVARALAVAAVVVTSFASAQATVGDTWGFMRNQVDAYGDLSDVERARLPASAVGLQVAAFSFYRRHLRRGDRYYVHVGPGAVAPGAPPGVDAATAVRTFARFDLLPAILVDDPSRADLVLAYGGEPPDLGARYARIDQAGRTPYFVASIAGRAHG
jgi:hypothetical protein